MTKNGKFLFSAINRFSPQDMKELLESLGVELKTERGRRVFPTSDKSSDILSALTRYASGCSFVRAKAKAIALDGDRAVGVVTDQGTFECDSVILATGGASYPLTGSDGSGYRIARAAGHTVTYGTI